MIGGLPPSFFALVAAIIWALGAVIAKRCLTEGASPILLALLSSFAGTLLFWGLLVLDQGGHALSGLTLPMIAAFGTAAILASFLGRFVFYVGIDHVGATVAQTGVTAYPMFAVIFAYVLIGEPVRFFEFFGMLVIISGLIVLSLSSGGDITGWKPRELFIPIGAAILFAGGDSLRRYGFITTEATPIEGTALNSITALLGLSGYVMLTERRAVFRIPRTTYPYAIAAGILTPIGILSLMTGLSLGRVVIVVPLAATVPLFTILFTYILIGDLERITKGLILGSVFVLVGILLITGV